MAFPRRLLGDFAILLGVLAAGVAIWLHLMVLSILMPDRLASKTTQLIANPAVQSALSDSLSNAIFPYTATAGIVVTQTQLQSIVKSALLNPAIETQFSQALQNADLRLAGRASGPVTIGGPALTQQIANDLHSYSPALSSAIASKNLVITIPGTDLPNLGWLMTAAQRYQRLLAVGAVILFILGLSIHPERPRALKHIGASLIGMSAIGFTLFDLVPKYLLPQIPLSWAQVGAALLLAAGSGIAYFYLELVAAGAAVYTLGLFAKRLS